MMNDERSNRAEGLPPDNVYCCKCWKVISKDVRYCPHCGTYQNYRHEQAVQHRHQERWEIIKGIIVFYTVYLVTILPLFWLDDRNAAAGILIISGIDAFVVLVYWGAGRISILPLFRLNREAFLYLLLGIGSLVPLLFINYGYHDVLINLFGAEEIKISDPFINAGYGYGMIVFGNCLMPAVLEEIAFRGLIQTGLGKVIRQWEALFLTSLLFAIIHATALSWPYLFLVGLALGILRMKSQSLWPAIVMHFLHNFVISYIEYSGIMGS